MIIHAFTTVHWPSYPKLTYKNIRIKKKKQMHHNVFKASEMLDPGRGPVKAPRPGAANRYTTEVHNVDCNDSLFLFPCGESSSHGKPQKPSSFSSHFYIVCYRRVIPQKALYYSHDATRPPPSVVFPGTSPPAATAAAIGPEVACDISCLTSNLISKK